MQSVLTLNLPPLKHLTPQVPESISGLGGLGCHELTSDVARGSLGACAEITALAEGWERQRGWVKLPLVVFIEGWAGKTSL